MTSHEHEQTVVGQLTVAADAISEHASCIAAGCVASAMAMSPIRHVLALEHELSNR